MHVSVYITSYNQKQYLHEAIESVLAQSLAPSQVIIVDDHSSDGSQDVIAAFHKRYPNLITPIYHQRNTGVTQARIDALKSVTRHYVTYVDGDDRLLPTKLEKEVSLLEGSPNADIAFSNSFYITPDGVRTGVWAETQKPPQGDIFCQTFARDFPRRSLFRMELVNYRAWRHIGFHDPNLHLYEDYDMRIRLTKSLRAVYYDEPLSEIRLHRSGLSSSGTAQHIKALEYIYEKNKSLLNDVTEPQRKHINDKWTQWMGQVALSGAIKAFADRRYLQTGSLMLAAMRYDPALLARPSSGRACVVAPLRHIPPLWRMWLMVARKRA